MLSIAAIEMSHWLNRFFVQLNSVEIALVEPYLCSINSCRSWYTGSEQKHSTTQYLTRNMLLFKPDQSFQERAKVFTTFRQFWSGRTKILVTSHLEACYSPLVKGGVSPLCAYSFLTGKGSSLHKYCGRAPRRARCAALSFVRTQAYERNRERLVDTAHALN